VIAILALIVVPRLLGAGRKAKESALKGNLQQLRNTIEQFQSDTGIYPAALSDLVATAGSDPTGTPADSYKGPYLTPKGGIGGTGLPKNPFSSQTSATVTDHWLYTAADGSVKVPAAQDTLTTVEDGVTFDEL